MSHPPSLLPRSRVCSRLLASLRCSALLCLCLSSTQSRELLIHWYTNEGLSDRRITYRLLHERRAWIQLISLQQGAGVLSSWCFCLITWVNRKRKKKLGENKKKKQTNILLTRFSYIISAASSGRSSRCIAKSSQVRFVNELFPATGFFWKFSRTD